MTVAIDAYEETARVFQSLGDKGRVAIMAVLAAGELNVSAICEQLGAPQGSVSGNLGLLFNAGLVRRRRDGKRIFYSHADLTKHRSGRKCTLGIEGLNAAKFGPAELILT